MHWEYGSKLENLSEGVLMDLECTHLLQWLTSVQSEVWMQKDGQVDPIAVQRLEKWPHWTQKRHPWEDW